VSAKLDDEVYMDANANANGARNGVDSMTNARIRGGDDCNGEGSRNLRHVESAGAVW
jgi:hypothetical protein